MEHEVRELTTKIIHCILKTDCGTNTFKCMYFVISEIGIITLKYVNELVLVFSGWWMQLSVFPWLKVPLETKRCTGAVKPKYHFARDPCL